MPNTMSPQPEPETLRRLVDEVLAGNDVTLFIRGDAARALLDAGADCLVKLRSRALRVAGAPPDALSLAALLAQVAGQPDQGTRNDEFLKQSFQALTTLDAACDRIVLLVSDANTLQPAALRYIQLACRAGTALQLVFAGRRGFLEMLAPSEFADLRDRMAAGPILTPLSAAPVITRPLAPRPAPAKPAAAQPAIPQPAIPQPAIPQPAIPQPAIPQPAIPQPAIPQPAIPQPAIPQPATPEPVVTNPAASLAIPDAPPRPILVRQTPAVSATHPANRPPAVPLHRPMVNLARVSRRQRVAALAGVGLVAAASATFGAWNGWVGDRPEPRRQTALATPTPPAPPRPDPLPMIPDASVPAQVAPPGDGTPDTAPSSAAAIPGPAPASLASVPAALPSGPAAPDPPPPAAIGEAAAAIMAPAIAPAPPSALDVYSTPTPRPPRNASRRAVPPQPRVAARTPAVPAGSVAAWGDPYPSPSTEWRPAPPLQAPPAPPDQPAARPQTYIGTYTTDANGIRSFRFNP